jgi:protein-L-isoaspartate(D-aspartate) O-methyltransferase
LRLRGSVTRSIAFERDAAWPGVPRWRSVSTHLCTFMPLRGGVADDPATALPLAPDGSVSLAVHQDEAVNPAALAGALAAPPDAQWTGVTFTRAGHASAEWLVLWLTCTLRAPLSRLSARREALEYLMPLFPWGTMATADDASLAYLGARPAGDDAREVGVIGHGPRGAELAREAAAQVQAWDRHYRAATASFTVQPVSAPVPRASQFAFRTPHCWLGVDWQ